MQQNSNDQRRHVIASDVERISQLDYITGIQRVAHESHKGLFDLLSPDFYSFGSYISPDAEKSFGFLSNPELARDPVLNAKNHLLADIDTLLLVDFNTNFNFPALFAERAKRKIRVISVVYDVLPILQPEWFPEENSKMKFMVWLQNILLVSDHVVFNSNFVMDKVRDLQWRTGAQFHLIPLGATGLVHYMKHYSASPPTLISVSTIEPRKGHMEILDAYDQLRAKKRDYRLFIVGRAGWNFDEIVSRIVNHRDYGSRLRWFDNLSDLELSALYHNSQIAIVSSHAEGFGLAIEEALSHQVKVIARDISVFREREQQNLFFFETKSAPLLEVIEQVDRITWNPTGYESLRSMRDFIEELLALILST